MIIESRRFISKLSVKHTDSQSRNTLFMCCEALAVDEYVQATKAFRKTDQLLVCYSGPRKGQAASKMTISRWLDKLSRRLTFL